jgi:hypothetical protein
MSTLFGDFDGDDAKAAVVKAVLARGTLDKFQDPDDLMAAVGGLPYAVRVGAVCTLAKASSPAAVSAMVTAMLKPSRATPSASAVADDEDDELVRVFPDTGDSESVSHDRSQLALHMAAAKRDSEALLREVDCPKIGTQQLALKEACRRKNKTEAVAADADVDDALVQRLQNGAAMNPKVRKGILSSCVRQRRTRVLDRVLPAMQGQHLPVAAWLHGASSATVVALLPGCKEARADASCLSWRKLWAFHQPAMLAGLRGDLEGASSCLARVEVWDRWGGQSSGRMLFGAPHDGPKQQSKASAAPLATVLALYLEFPPYALAAGTGSSAAVHSLLLQQGPAFAPAEHPGALVVHVAPWLQSKVLAKTPTAVVVRTALGLGRGAATRPLVEALATRLMDSSKSSVGELQVGVGTGTVAPIMPIMHSPSERLALRHALAHCGCCRRESRQSRTDTSPPLAL